MVSSLTFLKQESIDVCEVKNASESIFEHEHHEEVEIRIPYSSMKQHNLTVSLSQDIVNQQ